jgi:hypothetical protein
VPSSTLFSTLIACHGCRRKDAIGRNQLVGKNVDYHTPASFGYRRTATLQLNTVSHILCKYAVFQQCHTLSGQMNPALIVFAAGQVCVS